MEVDGIIILIMWRRGRLLGVGLICPMGASDAEIRITMVKAMEEQRIIIDNAGNFQMEG
jgi:ApbE superfamily uncharacterized protein (UPF0280 family)